MGDKFIRHDHPDGDQGAHGARWILASGKRGDAIEVYGLRFNEGGLRISVSDYRSGTNTAAHGCICMDLDSAIEFANEIIRLANVLKQ